ncbi:MAG: GNAT family N-acetyltransferase [Clostridiales bacterium]|nr:GNAT family N-acetyltransferase [Clostridiales bacterium]
MDAVRDVVISETGDYGALVELFVANGLEFSSGEAAPEDLVKCWKAEEVGAPHDADCRNGTGDDARLVGGCVLARREGRIICDGIATEPDMRGRGIGARLLSLMVDEARAHGGDALYLVARAPGFFAKHGFAPVSRDEAPTFFECFVCPQYGESCHPEVMCLSL